LITDLENQIIAVHQTVFDRLGWFGVAGKMALENATSIAPSEIILGLLARPLPGETAWLALRGTR
jgi:hypothetical protein